MSDRVAGGVERGEVRLIRREEYEATVEQHRVRVSNTTAEQLALFDRVAAEVPVIAKQLRLAAFVVALANDYKPRLVLSFTTQPGTPAGRLGGRVVLKVYPDTPRGEGPLMQLWRSRAIPVPNCVSGVSGGCSWLALEHVALRRLQVHAPGDKHLLTEELARFGERMHRRAPRLRPVLRPLAEIMYPRWLSSVQVLEESGQTVGTDWHRRAVKSYAFGTQSPLHGDLALTNVAESVTTGNLVVYDASALSGTPIFDAVRWASRLGDRQASPLVLLHHWQEVEKVYSEDEVNLLAVECLLEAGSLQTRALREPTEGIGYNQRADFLLNFATSLVE